MEYATQMDAARKGIVTKEMEIVAKKENIDVESLRQLIAKGQVIIPANKNHKCLDPNGIGNKLRTKINVNLGTSRDCVDLDMELDKVNNGSFFFRRYTEVQKKADIRMSGNNWNSSYI